MQKLFVYFPLLMLLSLLSACAISPSGTPQQQRAEIDAMAHSTLNDMYARYPETRGIVKKAAAYGVFDASGGKVIFGGLDHGNGVVFSKREAPFYMKMFELQPGFGLGYTNFRLVFVFDNEDALRSFTTSGWEFGTRLSTAAKNQKQGGAFDLGYTAAPGITVYQITEKGIMIGISITGAKYWPNDELNANPAISHPSSS